MMKITGLSHLFKWENLHNWWLTKYFFAPLYIFRALTGQSRQRSSPSLEGKGEKACSTTTCERKDVERTLGT